VIGLLAIPLHSWLSVIALATGAGLLFLFATMVRTAGRSIEKRLMGHWGGMPTTRLLRYQGNERSSTLALRRRGIEAVLGTRLPSAERETADPDGADQEYEWATRRLISAVRLHADRFPRVQDENINYGFLRNMLGIKPFALGVLIGCYAVDLFAVFAIRSPAFIVVSSLANVLLSLVWLLYVTPARVGEAANLYADRLFECLMTPEVFSKNA
jgi:hypothetical protein